MTSEALGKRSWGSNVLAPFAAIAVVVAGAGGCNRPALGIAVGMVTSSGEPVRRGLVQFENQDDGRAYVAALDETGRFRCQVAAGYGLPPGPYAVAVKLPTSLPSLSWEPPVHSNPADFPEIPPKYHETSTSGLEVEIRKGVNPEMHFELE